MMIGHGLCTFSGKLFQLSSKVVAKMTSQDVKPKIVVVTNQFSIVTNTKLTFDRNQSKLVMMLASVKRKGHIGEANETTLRALNSAPFQRNLEILHVLKSDVLKTSKLTISIAVVTFSKVCRSTKVLLAKSFSRSFPWNECSCLACVTMSERLKGF